jgi:outer membrane protein assembly factor BamB
MTGSVWGVPRRAGAVVAASALLSGCWLQVGFAADHARHNVLESGITRDNVAGLHEAWSIDLPGSVSEPIAAGGRVYLTRSIFTEAADVRAFDAASGAEAWRRELVPPLPPDPTNIVIANPVAFSGGRLWLGYAATGLGIHLVSLHPADGSILTESNNDGQVVTTPVVTGQGVAAYAQVNPNASSSALVVRDPDTATIQWTAVLTLLPVEDVVIARGHVYAPDSSTLTAFAVAGCGAATCAPVWRAAVPGGARVRHVAVAPDGSVVISAGGSVTAFDGATGAVRWTRTLPGLPGETVAIAGDLIYVASQAVTDPAGGTTGENALLALSLADGTTRWTGPLPAGAAAPLVAAGVVYTGAGNDLYGFDAAGCSAATCDPLVTVPGGGSPRSIGEGRLYTTVFAPATGTTLRAFRVG